MKKFYLKHEENYIKLGQLLKASNMTGSGAESKILIQEGKVKVNGSVEIQRGKKIKEGDVVSLGGDEILVCR